MKPRQTFRSQPHRVRDSGVPAYVSESPLAVWIDFYAEIRSETVLIDYRKLGELGIFADENMRTRMIAMRDWVWLVIRAAL